jgi:hypothetical protein
VLRAGDSRAETASLSEERATACVDAHWQRLER